MNEYDNKKANGLDDKEENGLDKDEGEIKDGRYVPIPFVPLSPLPQKMLNRLSDLDEIIKGLKHIVYIPKICYLRNANFALEFPDKKGSKV